LAHIDQDCKPASIVAGAWPRALGHGDRVVLVDANYPATRGRRLIRLPGIDTPGVLQAVLSVFPIDTFIPEPYAIM
jgi:L-fucose mutarotase